MNYGYADLVAGLVQCFRCIGIPLREPITIGNVDVLDVELNSPVIVRLAESDHRCNRSVSSDGVSEKLSETWLLESFVRKKGHDLHAMLSRQRVDSLIERSPHYSETVDYVDLWAEHRDLVYMLDQTVVAVFSVDVVEKTLAAVLSARSCRRKQPACDQKKIPEA